MQKLAHPILAAGVEERLPGDILVMRFSLDAVAQAAPDLQALLSADERRRAERLVTPALRRRAAASRAALRVVLAAMIEREPADLIIDADAQGKPQLAGGGAAFSVSHSGDRLLIAASRTARGFGADVELLQIDRDVDGAARFALGPDDVAALATLGVERRTLGFLRLWTAKEATLKALGVGLRAGMRAVAIDPAGLSVLGGPERWDPRSATIDGAAFALTDISRDGDVACLAAPLQDGANSFG